MPLTNITSTNQVEPKWHIASPPTDEKLAIAVGAERDCRMISDVLSRLMDSWSAWYSRDPNAFLFIFIIGDVPGLKHLEDKHARCRVVRLVEVAAAADRVNRLTSWIRAEGIYNLYTHGVDRPSLESLWDAGIETVDVWASALDPAPAITSPHRVRAIVLLSCGAEQLKALRRQCSLPIYCFNVDYNLCVHSPRLQLRDKLGVCPGEKLIGIALKRVHGDLLAYFAQLSCVFTVSLFLLREDAESEDEQTELIATIESRIRTNNHSFRIIQHPITVPLSRAIEACDLYLDTDGPYASRGALIARQYDIDVANMDDGADVANIMTLLSQSRDPEIPVGVNFRVLSHRLWSWWLRFGLPDRVASREPSGIMFITSDLNQGGAQRSLVNISEELGKTKSVNLVVLRGASGTDHRDRLNKANVTVTSLHSITDVASKIAVLLGLIARINPRTLCYWNLELSVKVAIVKVLWFRNIDIVDVSPGPRLFELVENSTVFEDIGLTRAEYFSRLNSFVKKYKDGDIPLKYGAFEHKTYLVPNGVRAVDSQSFHPGSRRQLIVRPGSVDPRYAVLSYGRIAPAKLIERQLEVAAFLQRIVPESSLTIIGNVDPHCAERYWNQIVQVHARLKLKNVVYFSGPHDNYIDVLPQFRALLLLSHFQGSPNASLEAMACGLPIVANPDGGTADQVVDGTTGFLVDDWFPDIIAERLSRLLKNPELAINMGRAGRNRAEQVFSMRLMADGYANILRD